MEVLCRPRRLGCKAYRSELREFIELVRAGPESEMHRQEQTAMQRHPNVVRTTIAAEKSPVASVLRGF